MGLVNIRKATIVLVLSDAACRESLSQSLKKSGYTTVIGLDSAQKAIAQLKQTKADILVMEWELQDIPARELLKTLRTRRSNLPVIIIGSSEDQRDEAKDTGADKFYAQPVSTKELLEGLDKIMLTKMGITSASIAS